MRELVESNVADGNTRGSQSGDDNYETGDVGGRCI